MPKIEAPTVAEHRARREKLVVGAAVDILAAVGAAGVTPGSVAREAGIARTTVYQYFPSTSALLGAALEGLADRRGRRLARAVERAGADPRDRVAAFVRAALTDDAAPALAPGSVEPDVDVRVAAARARAHEPLRDAVDELGLSHPGLAVALVEGVLAGVEGECEAAASRECVTAFVLAGLEAAPRA